jgi:DNA ligase (NAD+)
MMNKLEQYLNHASRMYYGGTPIISDEVFDQLADSAGYTSVGAKERGNVEKHLYRMYSLQKHYEDQGVSPLDARACSVSVKLDGAAISILYVDGCLVRVLTRGDGIEGQVITDKFTNSNVIPLSIPHTGIVQIIGEIVAPKHIPNSRNYAAGALNLKDTEEFKTKAISFFAYGIFPSVKDTYDEDMQYVMRLGFHTVKESELDKIYPSDGIVFRVNSNLDSLSLGYATNYPKFAYALKERQPCVETTIIGVEWNTSRSGRVNPVAILEPVMIGDKKVSRATLNNPGFIEALDLRIGDTVAIRMAGCIIPEISHKVDA